MAEIKPLSAEELDHYRLGLAKIREIWPSSKEDEARLLATIDAKDAEIARLRETLECIRDYPPVGGRRDSDGYPFEIAIDSFAYRRMVDSYRAAARAALNPEKS